MTESKTISILISCPGDVTPEKEHIIRLCKVFSASNFGVSNVSFTVLDWKGYVGKCGIRPQEQLNCYFGDYDVYVGLLWKRFGTKTGTTNAEGLEYESGTEEEFSIAIEGYKSCGKPSLYFFIKNYDREPNNTPETEQLLKVCKFIDKHEKPKLNFLNKFESNDDFESQVVTLLKNLENEVLYKNKEEEKKTISKETRAKISDFIAHLPLIPEVYIERTLTSVKGIQDKESNLFLEVEPQTLYQLMLKKDRVVLLGDAGSGKSIELKHLSSKLCQEDSLLVPIFQNLNTYTPEQGIESFLPDFWKDIPQDLLLLIWDGLDEIEPKHFNSVVRQILSFSESHKSIKILLSCRTNFYELPINGASGTLSGFEPYFINDLNYKDIVDYFNKMYSTASSEDFIHEVSESNLGDLLAKPFFLTLIAEQFIKEETLQLSRADVIELCILNRIELDQTHFKNTVDLRSKKQEIMTLLQKVALSMEILSKNQIQESDLLELISGDEFNSLKFCTAFKKKDGEEYSWQFEHNNIQEFLAAKALSNLEFDKVLQFIAFAPSLNKVLPSWVNTLAFLFSILNVESHLFIDMLNWILKNDKEVIVKFEPDKISQELNCQIFQGIFNYYKSYDVWINSNKFGDAELARFGESEPNFRFLMDEIGSKENSRTIKQNAIRLLEHFKICRKDKKDEVEKLLLKQFDGNIDDPNFVHTVIYALKGVGCIGASTINQLMEKIGGRKNQNIRSSMYSILLESGKLDDHVNYIIEGYNLIDKNAIDDRDSVTLMDEEFYLEMCLKNIKSSKGLKEVIEFLADSDRLEYHNDMDKVLEAVIANSVYAYSMDMSVFDVFYSWFLKDIKKYRFDKKGFILKFFDQTNTREKAFLKVWHSRDDDDTERSKVLAIAKLITPDLMQFVFDEYLNHNLTNKDIEDIYYDMGWVNNPYRNEFETFIQNKTDLIISKPEPIDYEARNKEKLRMDFNLLFDKVKFQEVTLSIFEGQEKDVLTYDELYEIRKTNNKQIELEEYYPLSALQLVREFVEKGQSVTKNKVTCWFGNDGYEEWYRITHIYNYLINNKELEVGPEQIQWISLWCTNNVSKVDFKNAIQIHEDGKFTYKTLAVYIWYLSRRFNIDYPENILLNMLSFDFFEGHKWIGIEYLISRLDQQEIVIRMLENIQEGIADSHVLKNHIQYLAQNKIKESYPYILKEIINLKREDFQRRDFLDMFFEQTKDTESLKTIIDQVDPFIQWIILEKLKANHQELYVEKYLLEMTKTISNDSAAFGKAASMLVELQNIQGLKLYVNWLKNYLGGNLDESHAKCIVGLNIVEALPFLSEMLELSYVRGNKVDRFDRLNSIILDVFFNIALISEENFNQVRSCLHNFMNEKTSIHPDIKYLLLTIERLESQYFMKYAQSLTIKQVKEKLLLIG